jgi:hypothetical protein
MPDGGVHPERFCRCACQDIAGNTNQTLVAFLRPRSKYYLLD